MLTQRRGRPNVLGTRSLRGQRTAWATLGRDRFDDELSPLRRVEGNGRRPHGSCDQVSYIRPVQIRRFTKLDVPNPIPATQQKFLWIRQPSAEEKAERHVCREYCDREHRLRRTHRRAKSHDESIVVVVHQLDRWRHLLAQFLKRRARGRRDIRRELSEESGELFCG